MKKIGKKKGFPVGILFLMLFLLIALSAVISSAYFYFGVKKGIKDIEGYTKNYAITMADAFAEVAELSYRLKDYTKLKKLFQSKIRENTIDEAFFVLKDGELIAHSNKEREKQLEGNIANDEFAYNIELILLPVKEKKRDIQFIDYKIFEKKAPFKKIEMKLLKEYIYPKINIDGWLVTKAVFSMEKKKEEAVGTVNFIISKDRIYNYIKSQFDESGKLIIYMGALSFLLSVILSFIIFLRYKNSYRLISIGGRITAKTGKKPVVDAKTNELKADKDGRPDQDEDVSISADLDDLVIENGNGETGDISGIEIVPIEDIDDGINAGVRAGAGKHKIQNVIHSEELFNMRRSISDAIPIKKRKI